ncbi:hypothetical protein SANTM175S_01930 [Streptomyces antimycoticus]
MREEEGHPRRWAILVALCAALLVIVIDNTVLHVAVPAIGDAFEASTGQLQAVIDAYVVVFAGLLITAGVVSDRYGRRRTVVAGLLVFGVASALAACGPRRRGAVGRQRVVPGPRGASGDRAGGLPSGPCPHRVGRRVGLFRGQWGAAALRGRRGRGVHRRR